jgi:putative ABC transport system permease protein
LGCSRPRLFGMLLAEGLLLALLGYVGGIALSRLGIWALNRTAASSFHLHFQSGLQYSDALLLGVVLLLGALAALGPAIKAYYTNTLQQ